MNITEQKKLGFGMMRMPLLDPNDSTSFDYDQIQHMIDEYMAKGFNYFDTAWMYHGGTSEGIVKRCLLGKYPRESFTVTDKLPDYILKPGFGPQQVFETQLERTGLDYFDIYLVHDTNAQSIVNFEKYHCFEFVEELLDKGLVKHIGLSHHDGPELLEELLIRHPRIEFVQLQINYLDWDSLGVRARECYEVALKYGKKVLVMEPVKGGTLAKLPEEAEKILKEASPDMSVPSWAIRFAGSWPEIYMVLSGMSNLEQLRDNMSYMDDFRPLDEKEMETIGRVLDVFNGNIAIDCTGCNYCTVECPMNVQIPRLFSLYNADLQEIETKPWSAHEELYNNLVLTDGIGVVSDCIECGLCEDRCPQHLEIRENLKKVAEHFENK
ncbi:MAG: aldo/keto reductase [Firmicutes bacterium]|nr:aldo/keto reductase [Bacillota bacterium]